MHGFPCQDPKQHTSIGDPGVDACNAYNIMSTAFHNPLRTTIHTLEHPSLRQHTGHHSNSACTILLGWILPADQWLGIPHACTGQMHFHHDMCDRIYWRCTQQTNLAAIHLHHGIRPFCDQTQTWARRIKDYQSPVSCWKIGIQIAVISSGTYLREKIVLQGFFTCNQMTPPQFSLQLDEL